MSHSDLYKSPPKIYIERGKFKNTQMEGIYHIHGLEIQYRIPNKNPSTFVVKIDKPILSVHGKAMGQ